MQALEIHLPLNPLLPSTPAVSEFSLEVLVADSEIRYTEGLDTCRTRSCHDSRDESSSGSCSREFAILSRADHSRNLTEWKSTHYIFITIGIMYKGFSRILSQLHSRPHPQHLLLTSSSLNHCLASQQVLRHQMVPRLQSLSSNSHSDSNPLQPALP